MLYIKVDLGLGAGLRLMVKETRKDEVEARETRSRFTDSLPRAQQATSHGLQCLEEIMFE